MDVVLVARSALDRWALVEELGLDASAGTDRETGFARLVHPTAHPLDVVLVVRDATDLAWLRRLRATRVGASAWVVVVVAGIDPQHARRAGADVVVRWGEGSPVAADTRAGLAADRRPATVLPEARSTTA